MNRAPYGQKGLHVFYRHMNQGSVASNITLSHGTIEDISWVNPLGIKVLTDSFKSHIR